MNTESWRHIFDAIEYSTFNHDTQIRVSRTDIAYCRDAGVTETETLGVDLHVRPVHARTKRWDRE